MRGVARAYPRQVASAAARRRRGERASSFASSSSIAHDNCRVRVCCAAVVQRLEQRVQQRVQQRVPSPTTWPTDPIPSALAYTIAGVSRR